MRRRRMAALLAASVLAGCAGPALTDYSLAPPPPAGPQAPLGGKAPVIAVTRIVLPSDVDSTDLVVRDGAVLRRSMTGRWGSRLSIGMTARLADRLAERYPQALVTTTPLTDAPTVSIRINVARLYLGTDGTAVLEADWVVVPGDPRAPERRQRTRIALQAPTATDADVVAVTGTLVDRLAADIDVGTLR